MRGNWRKLHQGKLQVDEGENLLKCGWRDMEQGLRVATGSPSLGVIRAGLGNVLSNLFGKNLIPNLQVVWNSLKCLASVDNEQ